MVTIVRDSCTKLLHKPAIRNGVAAVADAIIFNTMLSVFVSALHCSRKVDSKICSYSAKETLPLRYKLQAPENDIGSEIRREFGTRSRIWPV